MTGREWIEVWREPDGFWRWRYRNPAEEIDLLANESHPDRSQAVRAARLAYPSVRDISIRRARPGVGSCAKRLAILAVLLWIPRKVFGGVRKLRKAAKVVRFFRRGSD